MTPEEIRIYNAAYRAAHRDKSVAYSRAYYIKNKETFQAKSRAYYEKHKDEKRSYDKEYRVLHQDERRAYLKRPEIREKAKIYQAARRKRPEGIAYTKQYLARPDVRERARALANIRYGKLDAKRKKARALRLNYGLRFEEFQDLIEKQGGACAVCGRADWNGKAPHVDHDHLTGNIRGILCVSCNFAVGHVHDDPKIAQALSDYLKKFSDHIKKAIANEPQPSAGNDGEKGRIA